MVKMVKMVVRGGRARPHGSRPSRQAPPSRKKRARPARSAATARGRRRGSGPRGGQTGQAHNGQTAVKRWSNTGGGCGMKCGPLEEGPDGRWSNWPQTGQRKAGQKRVEIARFRRGVLAAGGRGGGGRRAVVRLVKIVNKWSKWSKWSNTSGSDRSSKRALVRQLIAESLHTPPKNGKTKRRG